MIVGYGFGASFVALFAQLGGGIYTKAADVGADLVGKVEAGIPEDDPRNPAVIADLVGDNVGDCAGRGADLFESTAAENVGAMILGVALYQKLGPQYGILAIFFPLVARAFGLIASIAGVFSVRLKNENQDPMSALNRGYLVTTVLALAGFYISARAFTAQPSLRWACFLPRPISWLWTPSARSPTTPAASSRCPARPRTCASAPTAWTQSATQPRRSPRATPSARQPWRRFCCSRPIWRT